MMKKHLLFFLMAGLFAFTSCGTPGHDQEENEASAAEETNADDVSDEAEEKESEQKNDHP